MHPDPRSEPAAGVDEAVSIACAQVGVTPTAIQLLRRHSAAVYRVDTSTDALVVRLTWGPRSLPRAHRAIALTSRLADLNLPVLQPYRLPDADQPVTLATDPPRVATFWEYHRQDPDRGQPTIEDLASVLRRLHAVEQPPIELPAYEPLRSLRSVLISPQGQTLNPNDRRWLRHRIEHLGAAFPTLPSTLGVGIIHADAHLGNLLRAGDHAILSDWDSACTGPREIDLIPTIAHARFDPRTDAVDRFTDTYGFDPRTWHGYPMLREIRDLSMLSALILMAPVRTDCQTELHHRLATLRSGDSTTVWSRL